MTCDECDDLCAQTMNEIFEHVEQYCHPDINHK